MGDCFHNRTVLAENQHNFQYNCTTKGYILYEYGVHCLLTTYLLSPVLVMHSMHRLRFYKKLSDTTAETRDFAVIIRA